MKLYLYIKLKDLFIILYKMSCQISNDEDNNCEYWRTVKLDIVDEDETILNEVPDNVSEKNELSSLICEQDISELQEYLKDTLPENITKGSVNIITSSQEFNNVINSPDTLIIIDFHAQWCGPCKRIAPDYNKLATEYNNCIFLKINIEECERIAEKYNVSALPTFICLKNNEIVFESSGANLQKIRDFLKKNITLDNNEDF